MAGAGNDSKVGVAGAGAGGNIAAALTHEVPGLSFQVSGKGLMCHVVCIVLPWLCYGCQFYFVLA